VGRQRGQQPSSAAGSFCWKAGFVVKHVVFIEMDRCWCHWGCNMANYLESLLGLKAVTNFPPGFHSFFNHGGLHGPSVRTGSSVVTVHPKWKVKAEAYEITSIGNWETTESCCRAARNPNERPEFFVLNKLPLLLPRNLRGNVK